VLWAIVFIVVGFLLLYWLLVTTEGTYLGAKTVERLYDWTASRYDEIKQVDPVADAWLLAEPLISRLGGGSNTLILDVATGTGRLPLSLLRQFNYHGRIVGLDRSAKMLQQAQLKTGDSDRFFLIRGDAERLPFPDVTFDGVTCLEAMEFFPHPPIALREMIRVLKPGGVLLLSNRVGRDARLLPWRCCGRGRLERLMATMPLEEITSKRWQVHYDLIWAKKPSLQ